MTQSTLTADWENVKGDLRSFKKNLARQEAAVLLTIGTEVLKDSQDNYVPVDEGDLRDSGEVTVSPKGNSVTVSYGDWKAPIIHEHLSPMSPPSWQAAEASGKGITWTGGGQRGPKFLERPWMRRAATYLDDLGEELQVTKVGI